MNFKDQKINNQSKPKNDDLNQINTKLNQIKTASQSIHDILTDEDIEEMF